ncbi:hypothetical protein [Sulfitobacter sp. 1A15106]|uniref:hypothetical protein n=1 Tax=Sulfitobacter sp. 1A15106 TaxID=3368590 RepID=UPI003746AD39
MTDDGTLYIATENGWRTTGSTFVSSGSIDEAKEAALAHYRRTAGRKEDDALDELSVSAFERLGRDEQLLATAGAVYNSAYAKGWREGQARGLEFGRALHTHWAWLPVVTGAMIAGAVLTAVTYNLVSHLNTLQ